MAAWRALLARSRLSARFLIRSSTAIVTWRLFGLRVYYARGNHFFYLVLVAFVMVSSVMVSYMRARAESLIGSCKVGFMERPERWCW